MPESESSEDSALIERCRRGDKEAYGVLVQRYMKRAYATALAWVGSHNDALDLSQEAFVRAWRGLKHFNPEFRFFTWYYRILRNLCLNHLRNRKRRARPFSEVEKAQALEDIPDEWSDPSILAEQDEQKAAVWKALAALKEHEREILILKDFQEMSYKEIAEALDCPVGTVMSRLYHARRALRERLVKYR